MLVHCKCQQILKMKNLALISFLNKKYLNSNALEALIQSQQKGQVSR